MRNVFVLKLFSLLFLLANCGSVFAEPLIVEPTYFYLNGNDYTIKYPTFKAAYDVVKAEVAASRDAGTGLVHWRVVGSKPMGITYNGMMLLRVTMEVLERNQQTKQYDIWGPTIRGLGEVNTIPECPRGFRIDYRPENSYYTRLFDCVSENSYPEPCDTCDGVGNPILPSTKIKLQEEVDYRSGSGGGLEFVRIYRSDRNGWEHNFAMNGIDRKPSPPPPPEEPVEPPSATGRAAFSLCYWAIRPSTGKPHCFLPPSYPSENSFMLRRGNGRTTKFGGPNSFAPAKHVNDRWAPVWEYGAIVAHDIYNAANDSTERYGRDGLIQRITARNGNVTNFAYIPFQGPVTSISPTKLLSSVTDHFGRTLTFGYNEDGRLATMTTPGNEIYSYAYDEPSGGAAAIGNLTSVTYPDQRKRIYWYNEPAHTSGASLPFALTGITDENGIRFATFKYTATGYALSTEHAGEVDKYTMSSDGYTRYVTDPLGTKRTYSYSMQQGGLRLSSKSQPAGAGSSSTSERRTYDANGNLDTLTSVNGTVTKFTYDLDRNLELTRTEAFGLPEQRTTTTEWHADYRLPKRVAEPKRVTTYDYYTNGDLKTRSVQATADESGATGFAATKIGTVSTWSYTYNGKGQIATATGPRAGGVDKTVYVHDPVTGDLESIKNAAGHVTTLSDYDLNGRARLITLPNRSTVRMAYSPRGWLESRTVSDGTTSLVTTFGRDSVGQLTSLTNPDGTVMTLVYDDAHRLTDVLDAAGNKIHYDLNNLGSPVSEDVLDPSGTLRRQTTKKYDALNRLEIQTGGAR